MEMPRIVAVDGAVVRDNLETGFIGGTNAFASPQWCPQGTVVLEQGFSNRDLLAFLIHELKESALMATGQSYEDAHDAANRTEQRFRTMSKAAALLRVALLRKTAANVMPHGAPHIVPLKASSSYAPSPAIAPRGPGMAARMKAYDAPMKPVAPAAAPVAPKPTMPAAVTPRPLGQPAVPAAPPPALDHGFRPGSPPPMDALLKRLGVTGEIPAAPVGPQLGARLKDFLTRGTVTPATAASTAASGAMAGVAGVAAKNLADQRSGAPESAPTAAPDVPAPPPVAAPDGEPQLMPDVPRAPRYDPLEGMQA